MGGGKLESPQHQLQGNTHVLFGLCQRSVSSPLFFPGTLTHPASHHTSLKSSSSLLSQFLEYGLLVCLFVFNPMAFLNPHLWISTLPIGQNFAWSLCFRAPSWQWETGQSHTLKKISWVHSMQWTETWKKISFVCLETKSGEGENIVRCHIHRMWKHTSLNFFGTFSVTWRRLVYVLSTEFYHLGRKDNFLCENQMFSEISRKTSHFLADLIYIYSRNQDQTEQKISYWT